MSRRLISLTVGLTFITLTLPARANQLSTAAPNNQFTPATVFMDLTPAGAGLNVTSLDVYFNVAAGTATTLQVYFKAGTYVGSDGTAGNWTLHDTINATSNGTTTLVPIVLNTPLNLPAGQTTGVAIYSTSGLRYTGLGSAIQDTWSNGDLTLFSNHVRSAFFSGSTFTPRCFSGNVNYVPAGLGGAGSADPNPVPQSCNTLLTVMATPHPDGSNGIEVTGDLTAFGGSATQAFTETSPGSNVFTYNLAVPAAQPLGPNPITATVTDNELHTGNATINLTVAPAFTIVTAADPAAVDPTEQSLLTVAINVPACATSTGHTVTADLSPIEGSGSQQLFDDGPGGGHGDAAAGDGIYSYLATIGATTPPAAYSLNVTANDAQGHTVLDSILIGVGAFFEFEENDSKAAATVVDCITPGAFIQGTSTGSTITGTGLINSADYYRVKTCAAPLGIYKHRLTITTEGTAGHTTTIRGLTQTGGVINTGTDALLQTALTTVSGDLPARTVQWFGFGKEEEIYYRVTGTASTTEPYQATLSTTTVTPVVATQAFAPGDVTIMRAAGNTTDMDIWVYDSNFNAIPCFGGNSPEPVTVTGNLANGTYYVALTNTNFANDQPSCPPDTLLTSSVLDFPNAAANTSTTTNSILDVSISDQFGVTETIAVTKPGAFEIVFLQFTVAPSLGGAGAADPSTVAVGGTTLLTVTVNPDPGPPPSSGIMVLADLSAIGGSGSQMFFDDGTNGDLTLGDNVFSYLATVGAGTTPTSHSLPFTVTDTQGNNANGNISLTVLPASDFLDQEPNDVKPDATPVNGIMNGQTIAGISTGTSTTAPGLASADYFKVRTATAALGIYKHRLTITTEGTAGHASTIRGLTQTGGVINQGTDAIVQTALTAASGDLPARTVQWFGFGKEEEIFYRVTGTASTTDPYTSTLSTTPVSPIVATQVYQPGDITIMRAAGNTTDMDIWVYDSNFDAIPCLGRNSPEPVTLTGNFASGTYYVAVTNSNFANDQASCPPDTLLTGIVTDFPNAAANSSSTTSANLGITITDSFGGTETLPLTKPGAFEIVFVEFTVVPSGSLLASGAATPPSADPGDTTLLTVTVTPGQNPPSTGITVTGDLSSIGGSASQTFFDDGTNGDVTPGDNIFSYEATVAPGTPLGPVALPIHVQDLELRMFDFNIAFQVGLTYCTAGATTTTTTFEWISNVTMNNGSMDTLNNNSGVIQGVRYDDYTLSVPPVNMQPGVGQSIAVTVTETFEDDQVAVYVDWNRDGIFQVPDEATVLDGTPGPNPPSPFTFTGTITPPPGTPSVLTRMRIRMTDVSDAPLAPCGIVQYGEVEDYAINVQSTGCACPGDMDGNNQLNGNDVSGFVAAQIAASGACADVNNDTIVSNDDVTPFTTLLLTGAACP